MSRLTKRYTHRTYGELENLAMFYSTSVELASVDLASFNEQATKRDIRVIFVNIYTKFILGLGLNPHLPNSFWADTNAEVCRRLSTIFTN
jgi:hypothetical protein